MPIGGSAGDFVWEAQRLYNRMSDMLVTRPDIFVDGDVVCQYGDVEIAVLERRMTLRRRPTQPVIRGVKGCQPMWSQGPSGEDVARSIGNV